jgi:2-C-methyl-D-erythritol 2,4-cyclodiphosphate synthase
MQLVHQSGWVLGNLDATIIAQSPRMAPHIQRMRENLVADMAASLGQVNVKATTTEGLGFTGRKEGIAAHAVVLLQTPTG